MSLPWLDPAWRPAPRTVIVFAHGAVVNGWEMAPLRRRLAQAGYVVRQFTYRSMILGFEDNVERLRRFIAATDGDVVHVIGHSMGGVLARHAFEQRPDLRSGRIIAVGSPLVDCWVGRRFGRLHGRYGRHITGRTVHEFLLRPAESVWRGQRDLGVIAGVFPLGIGRFFRDLPGPNDGVVLWEETRLRGIRDHVTYRLNHFGLLLSRRTCTQMARFLATGSFAHDDDSVRDLSAVPANDRKR